MAGELATKTVLLPARLVARGSTSSPRPSGLRRLLRSA
jgi:hypothetical protein